MTVQALDREVASVVEDVVRALGVPTGLNDAQRTAEALYPSMLELRQMVAAVERQGFWVDAAGVRHYPTVAVDALVRRAAGLEPTPALAVVEHLDPVTQSMQATSVAPYAAPMDEQVISEYTRRIVAGVQRHVAAAGRDLVVDTASMHRMRYARVLGYSESGSCAFCSMLAGRGAVYANKDTAGLGKRFHDNCTCDVKLVDGSDWDGRDLDLEMLWDRSDGSLKDYRRVWRDYQNK